MDEASTGQITPSGTAGDEHYTELHTGKSPTCFDLGLYYSVQAAS